jgi:hypothetical protein
MREDENFHNADADICQRCGGTMSIATPALKFLHEQVHAEPYDDLLGLTQLPYVLFERIGQLMTDFASSQWPADRLEQQQARIAELEAACKAALRDVDADPGNRWLDTQTVVQLRAAIEEMAAWGENHLITCPNCGGTGRLKDCRYG